MSKLKILGLTVLLIFMSACETSHQNDAQLTEIDSDQAQETVINLGETEEVNSQIYREYFMNLEEIPQDEGSLRLDQNDHIYWMVGRNFPIQNFIYFPEDHILYQRYDEETDTVEIAYVIYAGGNLRDHILEEDLYVSWTYDFASGELRDLMQENAQGEAQDLIHFTDEEWADFSRSHRDNLVHMSRSIIG